MRDESSAKFSSKGTSVHLRLRKLHRFVLGELRELSYEVHMLHRVWYKGAAQYRHMVWWRQLQRVQKLGARAVTGPLANSVPLARDMRWQRGVVQHTSPSEPVNGVKALRALAALYAACWDEEEPKYWHAYVTRY